MDKDTIAINSPKEKHDHGPLKFPEGFLWGSATSAHQVEGNNTNSDWWQWEQTLPEKMRSGIATDQYNRFEEDFTLLKKLNQNSHRLSVEWAKIEPKEGEFDYSAIEHYKKVLKSLKEKNLTVMLTLWHFTLPEWVAKKGGWENGKTIQYFARYVSKIVPEFENYVDLWISLNEPTIYGWAAYLAGVWPPKKKNYLLSLKVLWNLSRAHKKAYQIIHKQVKSAKVGFAHNVQSYHPYRKHSLVEQTAVVLGDFFTNHFFYFLTGDTHDFYGLNYYTHHRIKREHGLIPTIIQISKIKDLHLDASDLGWEIYPEGIFDVLTDLYKDKPVYITECGIASTNDDRRCRFLIQYLQAVYHAINAGVDVKGFFVWSLVDNFEWAEGFDPRFGLVEIDYTTLERHPRPSAYVYAEIAKHNGIPHQLLRFIGHTVKAEEVLSYKPHGFSGDKHEGSKVLCEHQELS